MLLTEMFKIKPAKFIFCTKLILKLHICLCKYVNYVLYMHYIVMFAWLIGEGPDPSHTDKAFTLLHDCK